MNYFNFDTEVYKFRECIEEILQTCNLEKLHKIKEYDVYKKGTDQKTIWHEQYYTHKEKFLEIYNEFVKNIVKPIFNESIVYQKIPNLRVHLVKNLGVFEFHKDKQYNHNLEEVNFFLPITDAYGSNTIWVESQEDVRDYAPMNTNYGQLVMWDGCNLSHGNKINQTSNTRISIDFRVVPFSKWKEESNAKSLNTNTSFSIGEYYDLI